MQKQVHQAPLKRALSQFVSERSTQCVADNNLASNAYGDGNCNASNGGSTGNGWWARLLEHALRVLMAEHAAEESSRPLRPRGHNHNHAAGVGGARAGEGGRVWETEDEEGGSPQEVRTAAPNTQSEFSIDPGPSRL